MQKTLLTLLQKQFHAFPALLEEVGCELELFLSQKEAEASGALRALNASQGYIYTQNHYYATTVKKMKEEAVHQRADLRKADVGDDEARLLPPETIRMGTVFIN